MEYYGLLGAMSMSAFAIRRERTGLNECFEMDTPLNLGSRSYELLPINRAYETKSLTAELKVR